jgi:hypothetical protein
MGRSSSAGQRQPDHSSSSSLRARREQQQQQDGVGAGTEGEAGLAGVQARPCMLLGSTRSSSNRSTCAAR